MKEKPDEPDVEEPPEKKAKKEKKERRRRRAEEKEKAAAAQRCSDKVLREKAFAVLLGKFLEGER
jgi:hypothetical protein